MPKASYTMLYIGLCIGLTCKDLHITLYYTHIYIIYYYYGIDPHQGDRSLRSRLLPGHASGAAFDDRREGEAVGLHAAPLHGLEGVQGQGPGQALQQRREGHGAHGDGGGAQQGQEVQGREPGGGEGAGAQGGEE